VWRHARAGLIAFAIVLALVEGCPIPPQRDVLPWQRGYVSVIRPIQRTIMTPFAWLPRGLVITQRFALFQSAEPNRYRLDIRARTRDGTERILFRAGDDDTAWMVQRHVRGVWNPTQHPTGQWLRFGKWYADRAFAADPALEVITFRFEKLRISGGVPHDTGEYTFGVQRVRGQP
jgi:hypothetical protein